MASLGLLNAYGGTSSEEEEVDRDNGGVGVESDRKEDAPQGREDGGAGATPSDLGSKADLAGARGGEAGREGTEGGRAGQQSEANDAEPSCDPVVQAKVAKFLELKRSQGRDLIDDIRKRKSFRNPDFLQKMVEHFDIEQYGSCYPRSVYDYKDVHGSDVYDKLEEQLMDLEQRRRADQRRRQEDQQRKAIEFQRAGFQGATKRRRWE